MPPRKEGTQQGHAVPIATVGIIVHAHHYRDSVVAAFRGARDLLGVDLGDGSPDTLLRAAHLRPNAMLLDVPGARLRELIQQLAPAIPHARLVAMNLLETEEQLVPLFEEGIMGFVPRDASAEDMLAIVRDVLRGEFSCPPRIVVAIAQRLHATAHRQITQPGHTDLTPRQIQIFQYVEQGLTNKQIAAKLGIEFSTVKNHVHRLLKKLAVHRRQQVVGRSAPVSARLGVVEGTSPRKRGR